MNEIEIIQQLERFPLDRISGFLIQPASSEIRYALETGTFSIRTINSGQSQILYSQFRECIQDGYCGVYSIGDGLVNNKQSKIVTIQIFDQNDRISKHIEDIFTKLEIPYHITRFECFQRENIIISLEISHG